MDRKPASDNDAPIAPETVGDPARAVRVAANGPVDLRALGADSTWQASSFDLAQGLDIKVMQSKLSRETLDRLFRG